MSKSGLGVSFLLAIISACLVQGQEEVAFPSSICGGNIPSSDTIPNLVFSTCCQFMGYPNANEILYNSLVAFFKAGGRGIDTSPFYWNSEEIIGMAIRDSGIPREDLWITDKISLGVWAFEEVDPRTWVLQQVNKSLAAMNLTYLNAMYFHFGPEQLLYEEGIILPYYHHREMWKGLLEARDKGLIRHVGVNQHTVEEVKNLMTIENPELFLLLLNIYSEEGQKAYADWLQDQGIAVMAYGTFLYKGMPGHTAQIAAAEKIAAKYGVTGNQIAVKWNLQRGYAIVTGLYMPEFLIEDGACLDFTLTEEDLATLNAVEPKLACVQFEGCIKQLMPGCRKPWTPDDPGHSEVNGPIDTAKCMLWMLSSTETALPTIAAQPAWIKAVALLTCLASLSAIAAGILRLRRRSLEAKSDLSAPFVLLQ